MQIQCMCVCVCVKVITAELRSKQTVQRLSLCTKCSILRFVCMLVATTQLLHVNKQHSYCSDGMSCNECSNKYARVKQAVSVLLHSREGEGSRGDHVTGTHVGTGTGSIFGPETGPNPDAEVTHNDRKFDRNLDRSCWYNQKLD